MSPTVHCHDIRGTLKQIAHDHGPTIRFHDHEGLGSAYGYGRPPGGREVLDAHGIEVQPTSKWPERVES